MKVLTRGFVLMFLGLIIVGSPGCGSDNESDAVKAANTGTPPPAAEGATPTSTPTYTSREDYAKQRKENVYAGTKLDKTAKKK